MKKIYHAEVRLVGESAALKHALAAITLTLPRIERVRAAKNQQYLTTMTKVFGLATVQNFEFVELSHADHLILVIRMTFTQKQAAKRLLKKETWELLTEGTSVNIFVNLNNTEVSKAGYVSNYNTGLCKVEPIFDINPRYDRALDMLVSSIEEISDFTTHLSPELYARIQSRGVAALKRATRKKNVDLSEATNALKSALLKAAEGCGAR